jgi:N-acetylmuramoyl-L-alanine amidase
VSRRTLRSLRTFPLLLVLAFGPAGGALVAQEPADPLAEQTEGARETAPEVEYETLEEGARIQDPQFSGARAVPEPLEGSIVLGEPAAVTARGPLFPLRAVTRRLGGKLVELEESVTLVLGDTEVIAGPGNPVMIVGREIVRLSQAPTMGRADGPGGADAGGDRARQGLLVPLDFLRQSYGRLTDYELSWSPERRELTAVRRRPRTLPVVIDVVHLQGVSTVVLRFPERVDYRLVERDEALEVHPLRDRLEPAAGRQAVRDPLVRNVRVSADRIRLDLVPGASAESYTLQDPFRLVFDVVRGDDRAPSRPDGTVGAVGGDGIDGPGGTGGEPLRPAEPPEEGLSTVVIDPGHGGSESGAVGPSGLLEKELTLEIARSLRNRLRQRLPVKVVLTRDEDAHLPLDTRSAIANQNKADLFVSIHLNSAMGHEARGAETYFLSMEASDSRAARTAELENAVGDEAEDEALYDLQLILWDLAQSYHLAASQRVANLIQQELNSTLGLRDRGVKQAPFRVLMGAAMPAVLVELGFLSNPEEESRLRDPRYRAELVEALVRAISRFRAEVERSAGLLTPEPDPGQIPEPGSELEPSAPEGTPPGARASGDPSS